MNKHDKRTLVIDFLNWSINKDLVRLNFVQTTDKIAETYIEERIIPQALETLKKHQEWRLGGVGEATDPKELTEATETIIFYVENAIK